MPTANPRYGSQQIYATCKFCDGPITRRTKYQVWLHIENEDGQCPPIKRPKVKP